MALSGIKIFKLLPGGKKEKEANCKKCGFSTCMAFAMKLAKKQTTIDKCPFICEELKEKLEESFCLQQEEICFGPKTNCVKIGNETVMFRHDKTFVNPTCIAISLDSNDSDFDKKLEKIANYSTERVGEFFKVNAVSLIDNAVLEDFINSAKKVIAINLPLILVTENIHNLKEVLSYTKECNPLVFYKGQEDIKVIESEFKVPVIISANSLEELSSKSNDIEVKNKVLNLSELNSRDAISNLTYIRRLAIEQKYKPFTYPVIAYIDDIKGIEEDIITKGIWAVSLLAKYANIIVLDSFQEEMIYSLCTFRQNIYTDPQKPLQVEAKLYEVGEVDENSPVFVTTNFALTYFSVVSEIESSNIPSYLLITPSDGMSVLTAWAASKFTGETIAKAIKSNDLENIVKHRNIIIPGYVDILKEEIEEEMPNWNVVIGSNEASELIDFLKQYMKN